MAASTPIKLAFIVMEPKGGAGNLPPIICAHGMTGSKEHWEDIMPTVADATKRKVYAIDARNHGDSEWSDAFNFDMNVDDIIHFMDTQGIPKAILVGHSMGGYTGIRAALRAPERVEKLIVEDMSVKRVSPEILGMVAMMTALIQNAVQQVPSDVDEDTARNIISEFIISKIPEEQKSIIKPESFKNLKLQLKRTEDGRYSSKANLKVLLKTLQDTSTMMTDIEGVYEGPALFVYGKMSPFQVGLDEPIIRKHFPKAELAGIENATHALHFDCPKEFTEAILNFILKE